MGPAEFLAYYSRRSLLLPQEDLGRFYGTAAHGRELRYQLLWPLDVARRAAFALAPAAVIASRQFRALAKFIIDPRLG
jgi:hypothetical protein